MSNSFNPLGIIMLIGLCVMLSSAISMTLFSSSEIHKTILFGSVLVGFFVLASATALFFVEIKIKLKRTNKK